MRKPIITVAFLFGSTVLAAGNPVDRWANAVGGRERVAAVTSTYREATIEVGGVQGSIKVWHTADGRYRKEEQIGTLSSIETFDGARGMVRQGDGAPRVMGDAELALARSTAFANWNAVFMAFFPERHRGAVVVEGDDTVVLRPEGGIERRVVLDPRTSLPATMTHKRGPVTITVTFVAYETVGGMKFEKEIYRATGAPAFDAVIRFTTTVINLPVDASRFSIAPPESPGGGAVRGSAHGQPSMRPTSMALLPIGRV
jgi:hypothetical protein